MIESLSNRHWEMGEGPYIPLLEPENPKHIEIISFNVASDGLEVLYYVDGQGREIFDKKPMSDLWDWAVKNKYISPVYELPVYDDENDEEYITICPPTSEQGTAAEINAARLQRFITGLTDSIVEEIFKT